MAWHEAFIPHPRNVCYDIENHLRHCCYPSPYLRLRHFGNEYVETRSFFFSRCYPVTMFGYWPKAKQKKEMQEANTSLFYGFGSFHSMRIPFIHHTSHRYSVAISIRHHYAQRIL